MSNRMQVTRWKRRSGKPRRGKSQVKVPQWTEGGPYPNTFKNTIKRGHSLLLPFQFFIQNMLCIFFSLKKKHNHDNSEWRLKYYCMTCLPHNIILHSFAISFQSIKPMDDIERSDSQRLDIRELLFSTTDGSATIMMTFCIICACVCFEDGGPQFLRQ